MKIFRFGMISFITFPIANFSTNFVHQNILSSYKSYFQLSLFAFLQIQS